MRTIAVWCPDWPVTAVRLDASLSADTPIAVLAGSRVAACNHVARTAGVRRQQRRREAQALCPELTVLPRNDTAEARQFEPVVKALESMAPGVEITRPGLAAIGARGPTRYFGGEDGVLAALATALEGMASVDVLIGIADGAFAAEQAARRAMIVPPGQSGDFLARLPVGTLDDAEFADVLYHLGLRTLGEFAALPARDVFARFGPSGAWAHLQAGGADDRPVAARKPPPELEVTVDFEPPLERVDTVAFSARTSAENFVARLAAHGLACVCLELQVSTANGDDVPSRRWRHTGVLGSHDVVDRIRWQLSALRLTSGITRLRVVPIEVVPTSAHQQTLWGGSGDGDERAERALARVQTMLGLGSVLRPVLAGGRDPVARTELAVWGEDPAPMLPRKQGVPPPQQPWPGSIPAPAPSVLFDPPRPVRVLDETGQSVIVTERGAVPRPPARIAVTDDAPVAVTAWAGPWPVDERWWSPSAARRVVRCQIVDARGRAYLVSAAMPRVQDAPASCTWHLEALYD